MQIYHKTLKRYFSVIFTLNLLFDFDVVLVYYDSWILHCTDYM